MTWPLPQWVAALAAACAILAFALAWWVVSKPIRRDGLLRAVAER
jgi:hypothetical protein